MKTRRQRRIEPDPIRYKLKVLDETPAIIVSHALSPTQLLLAKARFNRLVDRFLNSIATSIQSNVRTSLREYGCIEIDEVYVAMNHKGDCYAVPVRVQDSKNRIGITQLKQDLAFCRKAYPKLVPRPLAIQQIRIGEDEIVVLFALCEEDREVKLCSEKHYHLISSSKSTQGI